jgi:hypothetical protein
MLIGEFLSALSSTESLIFMGLSYALGKVVSSISFEVVPIVLIEAFNPRFELVLGLYLNLLNPLGP